MEIHIVNNDASFAFHKELSEFQSFPVFLLHKQSSYTGCIELHSTQYGETLFTGPNRRLRRGRRHSVRVYERN